MVCFYQKDILCSGVLTYVCCMFIEIDTKKFVNNSHMYHISVLLGIQKIGSLICKTNYQHWRTLLLRMKRNNSDIEKNEENFVTYNPFSTHTSLRNIVTCVITKQDENIHNLQWVWKRSLHNSVGKSHFNVSFKRKDKMKIFADEFNI